MTPSVDTYNNTIVFNQSQELNETPLYFAELQRLHSKNKKILSEIAYLNDNPDKANRIITCCDYLTYKVINSQFIKLSKVNLCRERLCLNCQLARSRDFIKKLFWSIPRLTLTQFEALYHITLTIPNCQADNIKSTIQKLCERQKAMFRAFNIKDYFRSVEITANRKNGTYHPHLHIIAVIDSGNKFPHAGTKESVSELRSLWNSWLNPESSYDYTLATCYKLRNTKGIFEVCKYISKVKDLTDIEVLSTFDKELKGLRLKTACGQFKTLIKEYKAECLQMKLEEAESLELAESYLIDLIYNPNISKYEVRRIYQDINYIRSFKDVR